MKNIVITTSDLHIGHTSIEDVVKMVREIAERVRREDLQVLALLVLGDIGESLMGIEQGLEALSSLSPVRICVPGNHDLYDSERLGSSRRRYQDLLPALGARHGYAWGIQDRPIIIDDTAIVTTTAWPRPERRIGQVDLDHKDVQAARDDLPDARWITQDLRGEQLSDEQLVLFRRALSAVPESVHRIIVGTHYPVLLGQNRRPVNAYTPWFLSPRFGDALGTWRETRPEAAVEVLSGHLHEHVDVMVDGVRARIIGSGYGQPGYTVVEV